MTGSGVIRHLGGQDGGSRSALADLFHLDFQRRQQLDLGNFWVHHHPTQGGMTDRRLFLRNGFCANFAPFQIGQSLGRRAEPKPGDWFDMPENGKASLVVRLIKGSAGVVAIGAPLLGIPVLGSAGAVVEKMPLAELEEWVNRMRGRFVTPRSEVIVPVVPPPSASSPKAQGTEVQPDAPVSGQLTEVESVKRAMNLVVSEPFAIAMTQAIAKLPKVLGDFIAVTYPAQTKDKLDDSGVGVWPIFALEWIARRHFQAELGQSAAAAESSDVRVLVERGLALDSIETLVAQIGNAGGVQLGGAVRVWSSDSSFAWPDIGDLSPGYIVAHVATSQRMYNLDSAKKVRIQLLGRLGQRGPDALAYLSAAWLRTCAAAKQPRAERAAAGTYVDVGLSEFDLSIFDAVSKTEQCSRESLRTTLHQAFVALEPIVTLLGDERPKLDYILRSAVGAFAQSDHGAFDEGVAAARVTLYVLGVTHKDPTINNAFENAFATMAKIRNWPLHSANDSKKK
jgi:hypothetical protein